ncbi:MAG: glycosyltransferase family 4 protein [Candidatus Rifleibacteriota bacterium]
MTEKKKIAVLASSKSFLDSRMHFLQRLIRAGHEVFCAVPDQLPANPLLENGVAFFSVPLQKCGLNPFADLLFLLRLKTLFKAQRPDMLIAYTIKPVIYGCLAARMAKISEVNSVIAGLGYAFINQSLRQKIAGFFATHLYRCALHDNRHVFFQNPDDQADFLKLDIVKPGQCHLVNGSGVDLEYFAFTPPPAGEKISFIFISRLLREKGILEFLAAAESLRRRHSRVEFRLLGPSEPGPSGFSEEEMRRRCVDAGVEFCGRTDDVRPFIQQCSVFVLPTWYREGVPRIILEALAVGRAIITTDSPGCRETLKDGLNGLFVPSRDVAGLEKAMEKFILNPGLVTQMGLESRRMAEERFDVHQVNEQMLQQLGLL